MYLFVAYRNQEVVIEISFETSPKSSALQWLTPEQTSGKEHPYLFSQCQVKKDPEWFVIQKIPSTLRLLKQSGQWSYGYSVLPKIAC